MNNEEIIELSLSGVRKKRIRIDGDDNRILELNTSDFGIMTRLDEVEPKIKETMHKYINSTHDDKGEVDIDNIGKVIAEADAEMRQHIDYIFDSNVSEVCCPFGTMFDPIGAKFRFEYIMEQLISLYNDNMNNEMKSMNTRFKSMIQKYKNGVQ